MGIGLQTTLDQRTAYAFLRWPPQQWAEFTLGLSYFRGSSRACGLCGLRGTWANSVDGLAGNRVQAPHFREAPCRSILRKISEATEPRRRDGNKFREVLPIV